MSNLPILQAFCEATESVLQPIPFGKWDPTVVVISYFHKNNSFRFDCYRALSKENSSSAAYETYSREGKFATTMKGAEVCLVAKEASAIVVEWFKDLPEKRHLEKKVKGRYRDRYSWLVPATDTNCLIIRHCFPQSRMIMNETAKIVYTKVILEFFVSAQRAKLQADFKKNKVIPELPESWIDSELPTKPYQRAAIAFSRNASTALFMEQGTGKTATSINLVSQESRESDRACDLVLIACPRQVKINWKKEIKKFSTVKGAVYIVDGTSNERIGKLAEVVRASSKEGNQVVYCIMSVDTAWRDEYLLKTIPWARIILDESHMIKSPRSQRWKGFKALRTHCDRRTILTGTPTGGNLMDLWTQLEFLGEGFSGFTSFSAFKSFYGKHIKITTQEGEEIDTLIGFKNVPLLHERLARLSFSMTQEEAGLDLPPLITSLWEVDFPKKFLDVYNSLAEDLTAEIETGLSSGTITAEHVLTKLIRLSQITSGFVKTDDVLNEDEELVSSGSIIQIDPENNPKMKETLEILEDMPDNEKLVIWAVYREDLRFIEETLTAKGYDVVSYHGSTPEAKRQANIDRFNNNPKCRVFIGHPKSAGTGINLFGYDAERPDDYKTDVTEMVFFSCNFDYISYSQAIKRSNRIGSRKRLNVRNLFVPGTIDEVIVDSLSAKKDTASLIGDMDKILENVLGSNLGLGNITGLPQLS